MCMLQWILMKVAPRVKTIMAAVAIIFGVGLLAMACGGKATPVNDAQAIPVPTYTPVPLTPTPLPAVYRVEIRLGGFAQLSGQDIGISFDQVVEDSRCPANVVCVWAGRAVVALTVTEADTSAVVRASLSPGSGIESPWARVASPRTGSGDISIRLISLKDYPGSDDNKENGGPGAVLEVMVGSG